MYVFCNAFSQSYIYATCLNMFKCWEYYCEHSTGALDGLYGNTLWLCGVFIRLTQQAAPVGLDVDVVYGNAHALLLRPLWVWHTRVNCSLTETRWNGTQGKTQYWRCSIYNNNNANHHINKHYTKYNNVKERCGFSWLNPSIMCKCHECQFFKEYVFKVYT